MNKNSLITVIIIFILLGGFYFFYNKSEKQDNIANLQKNSESTSSNSDSAPTVATTGTVAVENNLTISSVQNTEEPTTVTYTPTGFSPSTVTIKQGQTVTFVNQSGKKMWIGSAIHPTHEKYSGTTLKDHCPDTKLDSFDQCATGDIYTFIFKKAGTWGYHNHVSSGDKGIIIVTE